MKAIYARYDSICEEECDSLEAAKDFLQRIEDEGDCYAVCVYDGENKIAHVTENMEILGLTREDVFNEKLISLKEFGIYPLRIELYG